MQNMWLTAEEMGIGLQILSAFSSSQVESEIKKLLGIPPALKIGFTARLGYPTAEGAEQVKKYLRVRRDAGEFCHHGKYGVKAGEWP
jgi:nitroreductase